MHISNPKDSCVKLSHIHEILFLVFQCEIMLSAPNIEEVMTTKLVLKDHNLRKEIGQLWKKYKGRGPQKYLFFPFWFSVHLIFLN